MGAAPTPMPATSVPAPDIPQKPETLRRFCDEKQRNYGAIEKTCPFAFDVGADGRDSKKVGELLGPLRWLADMGIQTVIGVVPHVDQITPLEVPWARGHPGGSWPIASMPQLFPALIRRRLRQCATAHCGLYSGLRMLLERVWPWHRSPTAHVGIAWRRLG